MLLLLSGEGPTDLGHNVLDAEGTQFEPGTQFLPGAQFEPGPMAIFVDRIIEERLRYSLLGNNAVQYISESELAKHGKDLKRSLVLPGSKRPKGTGYFFTNARALAHLANTHPQAQDIIAVLFRDSDGTNSSPRNSWEEKYKSMREGFNAENFTCGVPMLPKPKSEAWLLCCKQEREDCAFLEDRSGNDASPNSLKRQLRDAFDGAYNREDLLELAHRSWDCLQCQARLETMPSFSRFSGRLREVVREVVRGG